MITVTHSAVNQIKKMMTSRSNIPHGVKLGINTKGCSGLSYTLEYVDNVDTNDEVFEFNNIKIITDIYAKAKLINKGLDGCDEFLVPIGNALKEKYGYEIGKEFEALNHKGLKFQIILTTDCLVSDKVSFSAYEQLFNADTLHLRLKVNLSEHQILELFSIDQKNKNKVDADNF